MRIVKEKNDSNINLEKRKVDNNNMSVKLDKEQLKAIYQLYYKLQTFCHETSPVYKQRFKPYLEEMQRLLCQNIEDVCTF